MSYPQKIVVANKILSLIFLFLINNTEQYFKNNTYVYKKIRNKIQKVISNITYNSIWLNNITENFVT